MYYRIRVSSESPVSPSSTLLVLCAIPYYSKSKSLIHLERVRGRINIMKLMEQGFKAASARLRSMVGMDAVDKELEALGQCRY